jgi:hypothetical protein
MTAFPYGESRRRSLIDRKLQHRYGKAAVTISSFFRRKLAEENAQAADVSAGWPHQTRVVP